MLLFAAKSTIILVAAWGITTLMRRSSAASRHVVWSCALLAILCLPVASRLVPALPLPWLAPASAAELAVASARTLPEREVFEATPAPAHPDPVRPGRTFRTAAVSPDAPVDTATDAWPALIWIAGAMAVLARLASGFTRRAALARTCTPVDRGPLADTVERYRLAMGIRRRVQVLEAPSEMMPATWGLLRPRVLLPPSAATWSADRLRLVLVHELSHVVRFDTLTAAITFAATALVWWHPLVWVAARRTQLERERACDDAVIRSGLTPSRYAEELLSLARTLPAPFAQRLALAMAQPLRLERRLDAILDPRQRRTGTSHVVALAASVLMALQLPLAALTVRQEDSVALPEVAAHPFGLNEAVNVTPSMTAWPRATPRLAPAAATATAPSALPPADDSQMGTASSALDGAWIPVDATQAARASALFDVGLSPIRGAFSATSALGALVITQDLPADIADTFQRLTGRNLRTFRLDDFAAGLSSAGDGANLTVYDVHGVRSTVAYRRPDTAPQTPAPQPIPAGQFGAGAYRPGPGVTSPVRLREVRPQYTPQAMRERIQGTIELDVVIGADGVVSDARVVRSLDATFGLDEQALKAVRATPFKAAEIAGRPVAVLVTFELAFVLDGAPAAATKVFGAGAYRLQAPPEGFVAPVRLEAIRPQYTPEALRQKIQGPVTIEAVVGVDGAVEDARVTTSLDSTFGLDAQALDAVRRTPFRPATLTGTPVRCVVTFDLMFTLR